MQVVVISADDIGRELARRLIKNGLTVTLLDTDIMQVERARREGLIAQHGDGTNSDDLQSAGIKQAEKFVAATSSDKTNLLACQIAMQKFGKRDVVARVNNPENLDNFESLGIHVVSPVQSTAMLLDNLVRRPAATELLTSASPGQSVQEATLINPRFTGRPIRDWSLEGNVLVVMARRNGDLFVVHGDTQLQQGDVLTLIGKDQAVDHTRRLIEES